ncbi:hypothetical protein JL722_1857 [Aureococcus anophagefferens]|nr:hypothetical protein JL722_1857 [Aureococcus anophagefferens]
MPGNAAGGDDSRYYDLSDTLWNNGKGIRVDYPVSTEALDDRAWTRDDFVRRIFTGSPPALELPPPPADDSDDDGRHDGGAGGGAHDPVESHQARERRLGVLGACCLSCLNPVTDTGTYSTLKRCAVCAGLMADALREAEALIAQNGGGADGERAAIKKFFRFDPLVVIYDESEPEPKTEPEADEPEPKALTFRRLKV